MTVEADEQPSGLRVMNLNLSLSMKALFLTIGSLTAVVCATPVIQPSHLTDRFVP